MNKFIILGCGYLGTNIANFICEKYNEKVYVLGIENEYNDYLNKKIHFIPKMIEQIGEDEVKLFKESIVIDAVGNINATDDSKNSSTVFLNNCASKVNLIQKLNRLEIKKYIFLSSGGTVYNDSDKPHVEDEKVNPQNIYALEKVIIEDYLKIYGMENNNFSYLILRLSNPYGGVVSKSKKQGIVDVANRKIKNQEILELYGDINNIRDYMYIDNVADYVYGLSISDVYNDIFNVGSGYGTSTGFILNYIERIYKKKIKLQLKKSETINIKCNILNVEKLKNVISISNILSIEEGLNKLK